MNKKILILFILSILLSSFFSFNTNVNLLIHDNDPKSSSASDISLDESSLTVPYGTNIQEDRPYDFSGAFYDITNDTREWQTPALLETKFVLDPDVAQNDTMTDLNNMERQSPDNSSISMTLGTQNSNGTLDQLDGDYANFSSTVENYIVAENFTTNYGNLNSSGNLTEIDGNYSTYQSGYETEVLNSTISINNGSSIQNFLGTYSFTSDAIDSDPNGWTTSEPASTSINVVHDTGGHYKTLSVYCGSSVAYPYACTTFGSITSGTYEWWVYPLQTNKYVICEISEGLFTSNKYYSIALKGDGHFGYFCTATGWTNFDMDTTYSANTWYHLRLDFNTSSATIYLNGAYKSAISTYGIPTYFNYFDVRTANLAGTQFFADAVGFSWSTNYTIGDNFYAHVEDLASIDGDYMVFSSIGMGLNISMTHQLGIDTRNLMVFHSLKTNITQLINISLYNFDSGVFDIFNSSTSLVFTLDSFTLNSSYYNASNYVIMNIVGANATNNFILYLEMLYAKNSPIMEVVSTISCGVFDNLVYSFATNITQHVEVYVYNFTSSTYVLIENSSYLTFNLNYTSIYSDYHNGTDIVARFRAVNQSHSDFTFYLEVLKVVNMTRIDFTLHANIDYMTYLLNLNCSGFYYTSILAQVNFSIYDFENSEWILINSSMNNETFYKSEYDKNSEITDLINASNDNQVLMRFHAYSNTGNAFELYLDCLNITVHRKLVLSYTKTFTLLGTWKYRFHIPDDDYASDWYYFDVVPHADNFMAISESPYITKWVLINNETLISTSRRFYDDMGGGITWVLITDDGDGTLAFSATPDVTYVYVGTPTSNYGGTTDSYVGYYAAGYWRIFFSYNYSANTDYYTDVFDPTATSSFYGYYSRVVGSVDTYYSYQVGSFDEYGITWNNQPSTIGGALGSMTRTFSPPTWAAIGLGTTPYMYYCIIYPLTSPSVKTMMNTDDAGSNKPYIIHYPLKSYQNTVSGYWYMQTDETEILTMQSSQFTDVSLKANDYFTIQCQGNVENINLQLLYGGSVVDTLTVFQDNVDEEQQLIEISVDSDVTFDQIQFTGLFSPTDRFKCYTVIADGYDTTTRLHTTTTYVAPEESDTLLLSTGIHQLKIYDNNILRVEKWVNITHDIQDNLEVYQPIYITTCRLTLIDQDNDLLDLNLFEIYATRTLSNTTNTISLIEEYFQADTGTTIDFEFYDRFGDSIKNETKEVQSFIFVEITMYSLKVKNDALNYSNIIISKIGSLTEIEDILAPGELHEYKLMTGNYSVNYTNNENGEITTYNISLSSDQVLVLPTSYFDVYFSVFNFDGLGLDGQLFKFYINNERKDFGKNTMTQITNNLKILDFFNASLFNSDINLGGISEYNIMIEVYAMFILNNYNRTIKMTIERANSSLILEQVIPSRSGVVYRFLPSIAYNISIFEQNDTFIDSEEVNLTKNNLIVNFGFYEAEVPPFPEITIPEFIDYVFVIIMLGIIIACMGVAFSITYRRYKKRNEKLERVIYDKNMLRRY